MNEEIPQNTSEDLDLAHRREWHKPTVQQIRISLDTGLLPGSAGDAEGGDLFFSDMRLKHDVAGFGNALEALLALEHSEGPIGAAGRQSVTKGSQYVRIIPILVEAIKEQQGMIQDLRAEVSRARRQATAQERSHHGSVGQE